MRILVKEEDKQFGFYLDKEEDGELIPLGFLPNIEAADERDIINLAMMPDVIPMANNIREGFESGLKAMAKALGHGDLEIVYE